MIDWSEVGWHALWIFGLAVLLAIRFYFRAHNRNNARRRTLIVGSGPQAQLLVQEFTCRPWVGIHVVGCTSDTSAENGAPVPVLGPINTTVRLVVDHAIDEIVFVTQDQEQIVRIAQQLFDRPVMLHLAPSLLDLAFARTPVETLGGIPLISLRESALTESQRFFKRLFDVVVSALLLLICAPLMLVIAIVIKLESPGPIVLRQERIGQHGRRFKMLKFRSMLPDAKERWSEIATREADGTLIYKRADDPRITRLGRKLRRTSLDELPQLFNVLLGDMSHGSGSVFGCRSV